MSYIVMTRICGRLRGIELSPQSDECDFRADSYACGEDGFTQARVYMEELSVLGIEPSELLEHQAAGAPAKE